MGIVRIFLPCRIPVRLSNKKHVWGGDEENAS